MHIQNIGLKNMKTLLALATFSVSLAFAAASSSTDPAVPKQPVRHIKDLQSTCLSVIARDYNQTVTAVARLHEDGRERLATQLFAAHLTNPLAKRISLQKKILYSPDRIGYIPYAAWNADGSKIISTTHDGHAHIWNAHTSGHLQTHRFGDRTITSAEFSPDGTRIASGSQDGYAHIWNAETGEPLITFPRYNGETFVSWSPNQSCLLVKGDRQWPRVYNATTGEEVAIMRERLGNGKSISVWSPDGSCIATVAHGRLTYIWNPTSGACLDMIHHAPHDVFSVAWSPNGRHIACILSNATINIYNTENYHLERTIDIKDSTDTSLSWLLKGSHPHSIAWSPDGSSISIIFTKKIDVWHVDSGNRLYTVNCYDLQSAAWNPHDASIVTASHKLEIFSGYQNELRTITSPVEQQFLLTAAQDWHAGQPHTVSEADDIYQSLITRFSFLDDSRLFTITREAPSIQQTDAHEPQAAPAENLQPAPSFWQRYRAPIITTGLIATACIVGGYLWNKYYKK